MSYGEYGTDEVFIPTRYQTGVGFGISIDGIELDAAPSMLNVTPDKTFIVQDTGMGRIRVRWPNMQRYGAVDIRIDGLTEQELRQLEMMCAGSGKVKKVSHAGRIYTTRFITLDIEPYGEQVIRYTANLSFHGALPAVTPPPGYGSQLVPEVRFTQTEGRIIQAALTQQGLIVQNEDGGLYSAYKQQTTPLGQAGNVTHMLPRDEDTTLLFEQDGGNLNVLSARNGRLKLVQTIPIPAGTVDMQPRAQVVDFLTKESASVDIFRVKQAMISTGRLSKPEWYAPNQQVALTGTLGTKVTFDQGQLLVVTPGTVQLGGSVPSTIVAPGTSVPQAVQLESGTAHFSTREAGVIAARHRTLQGDGYLRLSREREIKGTPDNAPSFQSGFFQGTELSPYQVTPAGLSVAQPGFAQTFQYAGVIQVLGQRLVTPYGVYRSQS